MNSANVRSVAADSNVLLSAVAGRAARRAFASSELIAVTTELNIAEVKEYIPEFAARYELPEELLLEGDYEGFPNGVFTTAALLKVLGV